MRSTCYRGGTAEHDEAKEEECHRYLPCEKAEALARSMPILSPGRRVLCVRLRVSKTGPPRAKAVSSVSGQVAANRLVFP